MQGVVKMSWNIDAFTGNLQYVTSSYTLSDTHGGHEDLHLHEFERVCNEVIDRKITLAMQKLEKALPQLINDKLEEVAAAYLKGTEYDVDVVAQVALDSGNEIYRGEQVKKVISDAIFNEIKKQLNKKTFTI